MICTSTPKRQPHQQRQLLSKQRAIGNLTTWADDDWTGWHIGAAWGVNCIHTWGNLQSQSSHHRGREFPPDERIARQVLCSVQRAATCSFNLDLTTHTQRRLGRIPTWHYS